MSNAVLPLDPFELRPLLHAEIDRLGDEDVAVLHRIALELELEAVSKQLDEAFDAARSAGRLENIAGTIREARAVIRARQAS